MEQSSATTGAQRLLTVHQDLMSHVPIPPCRFLQYEPYCHQRSFKTMIKDAITMTPEVGFKRLQAILQVR